jgi:cytochrome b6-f complex iron-sulfur subunit
MRRRFTTPRETFWLTPQDRLKVFVSIAALMAMLVIGATSLAFVASFSWPTRDAGSPTAQVYAGRVDEFEVGQPVEFRDGKFWLVKQEDGSFIALFWRDPHLGCTVPWRPDFRFTDPRTGESKEGWFRDPCYGATYDVNGVRVFGPSPRNLDQFPVEIVGDQVYVLASEAKLILGATPKY